MKKYLGIIFCCLTIFAGCAKADIPPLYFKIGYLGPGISIALQNKWGVDFGGFSSSGQTGSLDSRLIAKECPDPMLPCRIEIFYHQLTGSGHLAYLYINMKDNTISRLDYTHDFISVKQQGQRLIYITE